MQEEADEQQEGAEVQEEEDEQQEGADIEIDVE